MREKLRNKLQYKIILLRGRGSRREAKYMEGERCRERGLRKGKEERGVGVGVYTFFFFIRTSKVKTSLGCP